MPVSGSQARFDLAVGVTDSPDGRLELAAEYSTELFHTDRIDRLLDHFVSALANGLARPDRPVSEIEVMPHAERHRVVRAWNATAAAYHAEPLHRLFEAAVARTPDAVAVVDHDGSHRTYRDLDTAANRLAHRLRRYGVGPDVPVGVCLPRGTDLVTTLLAVWKAGGAYVPLDPALPPERITSMLVDATPPVVVTHSAYASAFPTAIALDAARAGLDAEPATAPHDSSTLDNAAYVIYTSGSTGRPKGVIVPHRGIVNRLRWMQDAYRLGADDRVLQKTPFSFDVSVWEFFWPLIAGASLVLAAPGGHRDPAPAPTSSPRTGDHAALRAVDAAAFLDEPRPAAAAPALRPCSQRRGAARRQARRFLARPGAELVNLYGPTEAAIDVTRCRADADRRPVPIGRPDRQHPLRVLDTPAAAGAVGAPGELCIAGVGLAHGYLNRPRPDRRALPGRPAAPPGAADVPHG